MSYFSNLLSSTTSRYTSLRRALLSSTSEDDSSIDDPECSHVSRVLRAYYTEKNRPFPPWLGPDPKAVSHGSQPQHQQSFAGSATGSPKSLSSSAKNSSGASAGGLGDIWADDPGVERPAEDSGSLRRGWRARPGLKGVTPPQSQNGSSFNARQLPSQREGSYQAQSRSFEQQQYPLRQQVTQPTPPGRNTSPVPPSSAGSGSLQDRLKARLGGR